MKSHRLPLVSLFAFFCISSSPTACRSGSTPVIPPGVTSADETETNFTAPVECRLIEQGYGPNGLVPIRVQQLVTGLNVPWGIAFLSESEFLVTERTGQVRLVRNGRPLPRAVIDIENAASRREGGLLGIAVHPNVAENGFFYVYYTARTDDGEVNRVVRYRLSAEHTTATFDRIMVDRIPAGVFHDGGRLRFGPDGHLYIGTGDGRDPDKSQQRDSLAGKILGITADGEVPTDNPFSGSPVYILGVRNIQAFDWLNPSTLVVADHGPTGELGRSGHDELGIARAGENLGWPLAWQCDQQEGFVAPLLVWRRALPPGGLIHYTGNSIPEWKGSVLIATLRSEHLQRVVIEESGGITRVARHEVYLAGEYGRLRDVVQAPDGSLYVTTSNCDGRGTCGSEKDMILRITRQ